MTNSRFIVEPHGWCENEVIETKLSMEGLEGYLVKGVFDQGGIWLRGYFTTKVAFTKYSLGRYPLSRTMVVVLWKVLFGKRDKEERGVVIVIVLVLVKKSTASRGAGFPAATGCSSEMGSYEYS